MKQSYSTQTGLGARQKLQLSVFGYTNFRSYLLDFYHFRKDSDRGYSYRAFSKAAGFASPNILKLVIDGKRNIGHEALEAFVKALGLTGDQAEYFRTLVRMNQAKSDDERNSWYERLKDLTPHARRRELNPEAHKYLSHWLYPVLREMVTVAGFREDPYWIARRLNGGATVQEIAAALRFLVHEGFLERNAQGRLEPADHMVLTSDEVASLAIRNFHRQMVDQAKNTLESLPMGQREFGAVTFLLPEAAIEELKFKIKQFRQELHRWAVAAVNEQAGEMVLQVNVQMYPHTKPLRQDSDKSANGASDGAPTEEAHHAG